MAWSSTSPLIANSVQLDILHAFYIGNPTVACASDAELVGHGRWRRYWLVHRVSWFYSFQLPSLIFM
jgi:hypothetical protein